MSPALPNHFWTITYGKREDWDYSNEEAGMEYAYISWDYSNDEHENMMSDDYYAYQESRPVRLGWLDELLAHIGEEKYIHNIRYKWNGELLVFYRLNTYRH
jgi:hypothetical protein